MSNRNEIRELALAVGNGLTAYIEVHNKIFHEAATFRSLLKNVFGCGVPMSRLLEDAERLVPMWTGILERIELFQRRAYSLLTLDERSYFEFLSRYATALRDTVQALVDRQRLLNEGSQGGQNNPLTWEVFQEKERLYNSAIEEYLSIGRELNAAAPSIFD